MDTELKDRIWLAMPQLPLQDENARLERIDARLREEMSVTPKRRRRYRVLAPVIAAAVLACIATGAIASGGLPSWLAPDKPASHVHAFRAPQDTTGAILRAFRHPTPADRELDDHMLAAMQTNLQETTPGERLLSVRYYRQLLDWTDPQHRLLQIVAIPTSAGRICLFASVHEIPHGGIGQAGCSSQLTGTRPVGGGGWSSTGRDIDTYGVMSDDVTAVEVVQRNGEHSAAHLGTNAYWWTTHSPWTEFRHATKFPRYLEVTTRDGSTRRFTLGGVPWAEAVAEAKAIKASRVAKCTRWSHEGRTPMPAVCRYVGVR